MLDDTKTDILHSLAKQMDNETKNEERGSRESSVGLLLSSLLEEAMRRMNVQAPAYLFPSLSSE